jgi:hypothetical protein
VERAGLQESEQEADSSLIAALDTRGDIVVISGRIYHRRVLLELGARAVGLTTAHTAAHPLQWGNRQGRVARRRAFRTTRRRSIA